MTRKKALLWSYAAGGYRSTVTVCEREAGGMLYARIWDGAAKEIVYISLQHRDRDRAMQYARDESEKLKRGRVAVHRGVVTVGHLLDEYLKHRSSEKASANSRREDERRATMFKTVLGADTDATYVTLADWKELARKRTEGSIDASGNAVRGKVARAKHAVAAGGLRSDAIFIRAVYYWAMTWQVRGGGTLLVANPFGAPAKGVRSAFIVPKNTTPARPLIDDARYHQLRAVARQVLMSAKKTDPGAVRVAVAPRKFGRYGTVVVGHRWRRPSYLFEMLTLAWETGRRRGAWRTLLASDLLWGDIEPNDAVSVQGGKNSPPAGKRRGIVAIRWKPTKHADQSAVVPASRELGRVLEAYLQDSPRVGNVPLFPSPKKPDQAIDARECYEWLQEAEALAGLTHLGGGAWHMFRRSWLTKRKHHAPKDVMEGAGLKSRKVLEMVYQQTTNEDLVEVIEHPKVLKQQSSEAG